MLSISGNAQTEKPVAELIDGKPVMIVDKEVLLKNWNANLEKYSGIIGEFTNIEIIEADGNYYLSASGKIYKSSTILELAKAGSNLLVATGITCTTRDCATIAGCLPNSRKTACSDCGYNGDCTKTVSSLSVVDSIQD